MALARLEGVENVDVSLKKAQVTFGLKLGKELRPDILRKTVVDAGFAPRDIFITVMGMLKEKDGKPIFQHVGSSQVFSLVENPEFAKLKREGLKEIGLVAKVVGEKSPLSLEIQKYQK